LLSDLSLAFLPYTPPITGEHHHRFIHVWSVFQAGSISQGIIADTAPLALATAVPTTRRPTANTYTPSLKTNVGRGVWIGFPAPPSGGTTQRLVLHCLQCPQAGLVSRCPLCHLSTSLSLLAALPCSTTIISWYRVSRKPLEFES
jgi:hypothetical protein